jgi:hypothetical protein
VLAPYRQKRPAFAYQIFAVVIPTASVESQLHVPGLTGGVNMIAKPIAMENHLAAGPIASSLLI